MPTITKNPRNYDNSLGSTPWGNLSALHYNLKTNTSGGVEGSDASTTAVASGDKIRVGLIPAGTKLVDSEVIISDAFTASVTAAIGFEYEDGVDSTEVPQDAAYFGTGLVMSSAARLRNATSKKVVTLPKDAWLIVTTGGATHNTAADADILVFGIAQGVK